MTVHKQLLTIRDASKVTHLETSPNSVHQQTENGKWTFFFIDFGSAHDKIALKLSTLGRLAESTNQNIRDMYVISILK